MSRGVKTSMAAQSGRVGLDRVVEFAYRRLRLDVAYIAELRSGGQVYRAVAGDTASFGIVCDGSPVLGATYAKRMVAGEIPNIIHDARADHRVADRPVSEQARIGAFLGVPLRLSDGTLYGALCCVGYEPKQTIGEHDLALLSMLGESIARDLDELRRRDELREELLAVLGAGRVDVAYQPIFDPRSGHCVGIEALARFPEPFGSPDQTFAAAESLGLDVELDTLVIRHAWDMLPRLGIGQFLAVNVSPATLLELAPCANRQPDLSLAKLVVEVTEPAAIDAYATLRRELVPLRERGLRIAVDDAGAGYASLRHILELRPDFIKLDRWLIDGLADDSSRRVAVSAFVSLSRELGAKVVAEGVERAADLAAVAELGLEGAQGYLLGMPTTDLLTVSGWLEATEPIGREPSVRPALDRQLERLELDRRASHRLEAVGQLAAGVAHEINTPLQFVGDSVTFLRDAVDELVTLTGLYRETLHSDAPMPLEERRRVMYEAEQRADVEYLCERIPAAFKRTSDGIARVRSIVLAMKRFSHASSSEAEPADINEAIETTLVVCRNEYKYVADIVLELGSLPEITCNIGELNQVFLNLIINAAQAIEEQVDSGGEHGRIRISTRMDGPTVLIEIADNGPGIPPALLDRVYEPFFTTKDVGKGTGQGLALARATIARHAGSLACTSTLGEGTTFTIRLPLPQPSTELVTAA